MGCRLTTQKLQITRCLTLSDQARLALPLTDYSGTMNGAAGLCGLQGFSASVRKGPGNLQR